MRDEFVDYLESVSPQIAVLLRLPEASGDVVVLAYRTGDTSRVFLMLRDEAILSLKKATEKEPNVLMAHVIERISAQPSASCARWVILSPGEEIGVNTCSVALVRGKILVCVQSAAWS